MVAALAEPMNEFSFSNCKRASSRNLFFLNSFYTYPFNSNLKLVALEKDPGVHKAGPLVIPFVNRDMIGK